MFSRKSTRRTAWTALMAVLFVVLMPTAISASGASHASPDSPGFSAICTLGGAKMLLPDAPNLPDVPGRALAHQQHCAFCSSSVPLFADAQTPRVVAVVEGGPIVVSHYLAELLPPDMVALQPLSPRAPPRR
jgi:hypothetical protein